MTFTYTWLGGSTLAGLQVEGVEVGLPLYTSLVAYTITHSAHKQYYVLLTVYTGGSRGFL